MSEQARVTVEEDSVVGDAGGRELRADIYRPPEPLETRPAVLLIHGGGWWMGDRAQLRYYGFALGRRGYLCVACEYRLTGVAAWPAQIHDVKTTLRWMRANSEELAIDPSRIATWAHSAGGHLALFAAGHAQRRRVRGRRRPRGRRHARRGGDLVLRADRAVALLAALEQRRGAARR